MKPKYLTEEEALKAVEDEEEIATPPTASQLDELRALITLPESDCVDMNRVTSMLRASIQLTKKNISERIKNIVQ